MFILEKLLCFLIIPVSGIFTYKIFPNAYPLVMAGAGLCCVGFLSRKDDPHIWMGVVAVITLAVVCLVKLLFWTFGATPEMNMTISRWVAAIVVSTIIISTKRND